MSAQQASDDRRVRDAYTQAGGRELLDRLVIEQLVRVDRLKIEQIPEMLEGAQAKHFALPDFLLYLGLLTKLDLLKIRAAFYRLDEVILDEVEVEEPLAKLLSVEQARRFQALPYSRSREGHLLVAVASGGEQGHLEEIKAALASQKVSFRLADPVELRAMIERTHNAINLLGDLAEMRGEGSRPLARAGADPDAPAVKFLTSLIQQAVDEGASDIHIEPDENETRIRLRIDGVLTELMKLEPGEQTTMIVNRIRTESGMDYDGTRPQDGSYEAEALGRKVKLRVVTMPTQYSVEATMRVLDPNRSLRDLTALGMSAKNRERYELATDKSTGICLATGPTGSGKSTTLYSSLLRVIRPEIKIMSIEDPIELRLHGVTQVEIPRRGNKEERWGFVEALKHTLRADPDVIMVGEIRDTGTAKLAVEAARTGHFVYSTLHTNDALSAITRLHDLCVEHFLIGQALKVVVAQRLVRLLCEHCKQPVVDPEAALTAAGCPDELLARHDGEPIYEPHPGGCNYCKQRGYSGRTALHEVLVVSPRLATAIEQGELPSALTAIAVEEGMEPLRTDGFEKILAGLTSIAELNRVAND